ncbi:hypothetical protein PHMEG_00019419, partial [Phytophthora megakarya]
MEDQNGGRAAPDASTFSPEATPATTASNPRLFIVCGRDRKVDELRAIFSTCGTIKHLHLALDRSKKSRGFAFLQYEDPANATAAIDKLDHMKLDDGHILKVTVAKERPVGSNGKLKRDQHARQDLDEKAAGGLQDAQLPGKRQRSSPPVAAHPLGLSPVTPAFLLGSRRLEGFGTDPVKLARFKMKTGIAGHLSLLNDKARPMKPKEGQNQVEQVLCAMLIVVDQNETQNQENCDLFTTYQRVVSDPNLANKQKLTIVVPGDKEEIEENTTDSLTSSIRSVSLAATPMTARRTDFNSLETPKVSREGETLPPFRSKHQLRRRRQSLDGSGSSTEDGPDGSGVRRKRSNTTTSPPSIKAQIRAHPPPSSPPRNFLDRSGISLSRGLLKVEIASKKCKRQSSDDAIEEPYRLAKQQATQERREHEGGIIDRGCTRPNIDDVDNDYGNNRDIKLEFKTEPTEPARTKLFFTSTYKFTEQELEAMFAVYGDFESAELVKSFGRIKTMAYIHYSKSCTAALVVTSFREESSQGDEDPERPEFMTILEA